MQRQRLDTAVHTDTLRDLELQNAGVRSECHGFDQILRPIQ